MANVVALHVMNSAARIMNYSVDLSMRNPKTFSEKEAVITVSAVTLLHVAMRIAGGWEWSFLASLTGVLFLAAFFLNKPFYGWTLIAWATMQMVVVKFPVGSGDFYLAQVASVNLGFTFKGKAGGYLTLGLNPIGIVYFVLAIKVKLESIYGKQFELRALKAGTVPDEFLPAGITIVKRVKLTEENSWYLITVAGKAAFGLIRGKDAVFLKSGEKMIVKYFVVNENDPIIQQSTGDLQSYKVGGWAVIPWAIC